MNTKSALMPILLAMLILTLITTKTTTVSAAAAKIYVSPAPPLVSTAEPGQTFTIQIRIANAPLMYSWFIRLKWNATILNCTGASEGPFLKAGGRKTLFVPTSAEELANMINNTRGTLYAGCVFLGEPREAQVSGNGILAFFTFQVKEAGETTLEPFDAEITNYDLVTSYPEEVEGVFVYPVAAFEVPKIIDGSKIAGTNITVDINTVNIQELKSFEFKLNYSNTVLEAVEVELKPFTQPNFNFTNVNATAGYVQINVTSYGTATPVSGNRTLASITFQVKQNRTACTLYLFDVKIIATGHVGWLSSYFTNVLHDVAVNITNASPESEVIVGGTVEITVMAENKPWATQNETFSIEVRAETEIIGTQTLENLRPGDSKQLTFTWDTTDLITETAVSYEIRAETDIIRAVINDVVIEEGNTTDNQYVYGHILVKPEAGILGIPIEYFAAGIIAVVVVIVVIVLYLRRRKHT